LRPKYFTSKGKVTNPTIINVEMKTAIWVNPAPLLRSAAVRGKAIKPGIKVMEPITAAVIIPIHPDFSPIKSEMVSVLSTDRDIPIIIKMDRNCGRMFSKDFQAFLKAIFVLDLFFLPKYKE